jgi:hypothetical protein
MYTVTHNDNTFKSTKETTDYGEDIFVDNLNVFLLSFCVIVTSKTAYRTFLPLVCMAV